MAPAVPDATILGYVHDVEVAHSWHLSIVNLLGHDLAHHQRVIGGGFIAMRYGSGGLIDARNKVAAQFLESDAEWLFWVDTDMGFAPDTVDRLLVNAHPVQRPIVGALCFAQRETEADGFGGYHTKPVPTTYQWAQLEDGRFGFTPWWDYPRDEVISVAGTGSACLVIHRSVFETIRDADGPVWYDRMENPSTGQKISEDLSFCARAAKHGFGTCVDTSVKTTHLKNLWLGEDTYPEPVSA